MLIFNLLSVKYRLFSPDFESLQLSQIFLGNCINHVAVMIYLHVQNDYPTVAANEKRFLNSGGFIGFAPELFSIVSHADITPSDDDQLYYTRIFLDQKLRVCSLYPSLKEPQVFLVIKKKLSCVPAGKVWNGSRHPQRDLPELERRTQRSRGEVPRKPELLVQQSQRLHSNCHSRQRPNQGWNHICCCELAVSCTNI